MGARRPDMIRNMNESITAGRMAPVEIINARELGIQRPLSTTGRPRLLLRAKG
jgi:hypothetical protein